jgi:uncharacterized protein
MMLETTTLWAALASLVAGFVDAVVGGGGLVQVPALFVLFPQLGVSQIIATNRFASFAGTSVAGYQYARKVQLPWRVIFFTASGAALMSYVGARVSSLLPAQVLKPIILVLITAIAVYTFLKKDLGQEEKIRVSFSLLPWYGLAVGMALGFYNGFVGPGTGSLLVFAFVSMLGYSFLKASAVAKVINVVADVASLVFFVAHGFVVYQVAIPMLVCNVLGSYLGSRLAILKGNSFVRVFFLVVVLGLILRFAWDIFKPR